MPASDLGLRVRLLFAGFALISCGPDVGSRDLGSEAPPPTSYPLDRPQTEGLNPNPDFHPIDSPGVGLSRHALTAQGEVLVIEGGPAFVTDGGGGAYGITDANQRAIVTEVLSQFPDRFDTVAIFLSFTDAAHMGTAYYQNVVNAVNGIGRNVYNGRRGWGLPPEGRFSGFVNMNAIDMWGPLERAGAPFSRYQAVLAQELSHRWLMFFQYQGPDGMPKQDLIGRQDAHWSPLVQAYGSVQDGILWRDNGDGSFTALSSEIGFAPLDLYGMGIYGPEEVEPFFHIVEATLAGMPVDKTSRIPVGSTVRGRAIEVKAEQVIAAMGPRDPPKGTESPYYRSAFVLVTQPGQAKSEWEPYLDAVKAVQANFPETWREWTLHAGAMCTKTSELCPEPVLDLEGYSVSDGGDDLVGPGESFDLHLSIRNDGIGAAEDVRVFVTPVTPGVQVLTGTVSATAIGERQVASVPMPVRAQLGAGLECGATVSLRARMKTQEGPSFYSTLDMMIGSRRLKFDPMHDPADWTIDPDGNDSAAAGQWGIGEPEFISVLGVVTQPGADHTPGEGNLSFHTGAQKGDRFSANDVDGGRTTLESPVLAIAGARYPSLVFYAWRVAVDLSQQGGPRPVAGADLVVSASNDGGTSWIEISRISEDTREWKRHSIALVPHLEPTNRMRFRFVIEDSTLSGTVEAGVDDLEIIDVLDTCPIPGAAKPSGDEKPGQVGGGVEPACGCRTSGRPRAELGLWALVVFGGAWLRARRRC